MKSTRRRIFLPKHRKARAEDLARAAKARKKEEQAQLDRTFMRKYVEILTSCTADMVVELDKSKLDPGSTPMTATLMFQTRPQLLRILWELGYSPYKAQVYSDTVLHRLIKKARSEHDQTNTDT